MIPTFQIWPAAAIGTARRQRAWGKMFLTAGTVPLAIGGALAVVTALECHAATPGINSLASWTLSLLYGAMLWLWWALVVEVLWRDGTEPKRGSARNVGAP